MLRKYLPRFEAGVLAAALAVLTACGDATGPGRESRLVLTADLPAADSVAQLGVEVTAALRDSVPLREVRLYVDSAAGAAPQQEVTGYNTYDARRWTFVAFVPGPGRHTVTVAVVDTAGRAASASLTRTFRLAEVAYTAAALPDLGGGANALHVNTTGDAAGWVAPAGGPQQPAVWKGGALTALPLPAGVTSAAAKRVNAAGDVLLQVRTADVYAFNASALVRRADGAIVPVGPVRYASSFYPANPYAYGTCCSIAADLNDQRQALGTSSYVALFQASARYDVAAGRLLDTLPATYTLLNNRGQLAGAARTGVVGYPSTVVIMQGFTLPAYPAGLAATACDPMARRYSVATPVALDDSANVLVNAACGSYAYLSAGGSAWLDRYVGRSVAAQLSPQGGVVAALDSAGAVYVWHAATRRAERVRLTGGAWRVDSLGAVNAAGAIAAHGVDAATGRAAALLLAPANR